MPLTAVAIILLAALASAAPIRLSLDNMNMSWADSYSVGGKCYCASNFDHGLKHVSMRGPGGRWMKVTDVCNYVGEGPEWANGSGRKYYNDIQVS